MTVKIIQATEKIYCKYSSQSEPQKCYLYVDCKNEKIYCEPNYDVGNAVGVDVYYNHTKRYQIPSGISAENANRIMETILPFAERIINGYDSVWDGNKFKAKYSDDAFSADEELEFYCQDYCYNYINFDDFDDENLT
jgi:hypothetical protein